MSAWGMWHAIRAIVDVHAKHNRDKLLAAVAEQRDKQPRPGESASQGGITTVEVGARDGTI